MFICNHCPYVLAVVDKLAEKGKELHDLGFGVAAICSNDAVAYPEDSFEKMGAFARQHHLPFPYLHDVTQAVARTYGAACTPDFFGFNSELKLQYRGRLDDSGREPAPGRAARALRCDEEDRRDRAGAARADAGHRLLDQVEGGVTPAIRAHGPAGHRRGVGWRRARRGRWSPISPGSRPAPGLGRFPARAARCCQR